jgi:cytochrome oxidase Cu insertion factor (SCO1/SenC/PrrC family)
MEIGSDFGVRAHKDEPIMMKKTLLTVGLLFGMAAAVTNARADLAVGDDAPDFSLQGSDGKTYTLSDFKGKQAVVVAWYPKAFTGG